MVESRLARVSLRQIEELVLSNDSHSSKSATTFLCTLTQKGVIIVINNIIVTNNVIL